MIKLELNSTDELALRHFGTALTNMASEIKGADAKQGTKQLHTMVQDANVKAEKLVEELTVESDDEPVGIDVKSHVHHGGVEQAVEVNDDPTKDRNGLPWDERIHSSSKAKVKDGSWKKRKGVDDETRETVEAELRALMAIPVTSVDESNAEHYPLYWRHDGTDEVGIIRNDEEYEQIFNTKGEIIDLISEELFNELNDPKTETVVQDVETVQADVIVSQPDTGTTPPPPPPVQEAVVPKHQDATPPPPPVIEDATVGNTPADAAEPVKFVDVTKYITSVMIAQKGMDMKTITNHIQDRFGVPFPALAKRPEILPQVMEFLHNEAGSK